MNVLELKEELAKNINKRVEIKVYGMRNKVNTFYGKIKTLYPNIFTIDDGDSEKSFSYVDVIIGDVKINYL